MTTHNRTRPSLRHGEAGIVLVTALLVTALITAIMGGMFAAINADQRAQGVDRDQTQAYAAAHAGLEKLTSDLVSLFVTDVSPTTSQIEELTTYPPELPGFEFVAPGGGPGSGYDIQYTVDGSGNPVTLQNADITAGPYQGFKGLITPFSIVVTARSEGGAEVRLRRDLQTVAVPVFQFGVFSDTDLTFYAGDNFDFGGRVHTNGHLYLSELNGFTLKFTDRITALGHVVRSHLSNGLSVSSVGFTGQVHVPTTIGSPGVYRHLKHTSPNEGSILGFPGATPTPSANSQWTSISVGTYKNNIRTGTTGAKRLDLPIVSQGAQPIDLIRRPASDDENTTNPLVYGQRYFTLASLRILLSDRAEDITDLPGVTATPPIELAGNWITTPPAGYTVGASTPPIATSQGWVSNLTGSSSTYSSGLAQIRVSGNIAPGFLIPSAGLTAQSSLGTVTNIQCTIKTATTFQGCNVPPPGIAAGGTVTVTYPSGYQVPPVPLTAAVTSGTGKTLTLSTATSSQPTAPFSPGLIWVNGTAVTCTGYNLTLSPQRFTDCRGLTAAPGSGQSISTWNWTNEGVGTIGGYIKVERRNADNTWTDVTAEILSLGIGAPNSDGAPCPDPSPDAVLRIQRLRDNGNPTSGSAAICTYSQSGNPYDWWPQGLYDAREGNYREVSTSTLMEMGGVMQFIELDIRNLKRWLAGEIGATGNQTVVDNGYIVYFSDRRGNHDWSDPNGETDPETGEYGWEDVVNPSSTTGAPNGILDGGEDVNLDGELQTYGSTPQALVIPAGTTVANQPSPFGNNPLTIANARPTTNISAAVARVNRTVLFRRALKLRNGGIVSGVNNLPAAGLTIAAENPVYVQGNYNATTSTTAEPNVPAAILADAVTLLSNSWSDALSFRAPNDRSQRPAETTGYRFAVLAGKNPSFVYPTAGNPQFLFGTDGGAGNFLRLLENWNRSNVSINYRGSIVSLYYSRQATGTFKFSTNVYSYGDRNFAFDTDFLQPALLPPGTPMFRDVNTLTFRQILRPNQ